MKDFFRGKKVLVTGHTGFKGAWLTQILLQWEAEVTGISLLPETSPNLFGLLGIENKINNHFFDIRSHEAVFATIKKEKPEIVFHLAAQPLVRDSYDDPLKTYSTNVMGTANVMQAIKEFGGIKAAVMITTDKVYKNKEWVYPYRECDPLGGYDPYSASKAAADIVVDSYIQSFFNPRDFGDKHQTLVAVTRAGNVIGGGDWARDRLVPDLMRAVYEKKEKLVIRSPRAIRPWEHVLEPLSGYMMLAQRLYQGEKDFSGAWNFGPNDESFIAVEDLISNSLQVLGRGEYESQPDNSKHEANLLKLDPSKAKCLLGWQPQFNIDQNIRTTMEWYKHFYEQAGDMADFTNRQIDAFFRTEAGKVTSAASIRQEQPLESK